ncbi:hypothetical protein VSS74_08075 [Conexibacter stalactiti]|uniref:Uncharacterized protein n=1 Tax=Conexibacter stalactiti TaxID=1940611 RepID=A0ABU4HQH0_9ACTN|nr:hypothetical protein [Conexibacter stalactiti]MDW5594289.1 hypothetical protein [Conexibacter stalactiti]MEC5034931.1 hypothetical protein [Conexibacter stalactiti]
MPTAEAPSRAGRSASQQGERRTIVIRGQVAPPPTRRHDYEYETTARRHRPRRASERIAGSRPDRAAMYAVLMGVFLILVAILTASGA